MVVCILCYICLIVVVVVTVRCLRGDSEVVVDLIDDRRVFVFFWCVEMEGFARTIDVIRSGSLSLKRGRREK